MKILSLFLFSLCIISCSKTTYVIKQGYQQIDLEARGRLNEDVLADKEISKKHKKQIKDILAYKKFFYDFFNEEPTTIYNKTTFLDNDAVTYLVIASPQDEIKALEHDFPIVGKFPYLGFFDKDDATNYAKELKKKGYEIYIRDVYAYSTLNQWIFNDNILSSFFHFERDELAALIFHELYHTVFFAPDEVEFNENLAQFFSRKLVEVYFKRKSEETMQIEAARKKDTLLYQSLAGHAKKLNEVYKSLKDNYQEARENYVLETMRPDLKAICEKNKIEKCWPLETKWNNAKFVSFITYESKQDKIKEFYTDKNFNLKSFYQFIKKRYKKYKKKSREESFQAFFFKG